MLVISHEFTGTFSIGDITRVKPFLKNLHVTIKHSIMFFVILCLFLENF